MYNLSSIFWYPDLDLGQLLCHIVCKPRDVLLIVTEERDSTVIMALAPERSFRLLSVRSRSQLPFCTVFTSGNSGITTDQ
jgi:hypothetical protein